MSIKDITIVITSFRSDEKIKVCLNSINADCKVIIVENSNNIEFKKSIEEEFANVECFLTGENLGYGKANNIGLQKVKTKYALILNPDTKLYSTTLENFINTLQAIPDFAIIGPHVQEKEVNKIDTKNLNPVLVKNVKGFAMLLNLAEFEKVGFFDENFFIYFEEIDLCTRLLKHKKKIYFAPNIKVYHAGGQSHDKSLNKTIELSRNWHWMWSTFNYHKKYKGFVVSLLIVFPKLSSAFFRVLFYLLIFKKEKKDIYYHRLSGLINAIRGKSSWYRPNV